MRKSTAALMAVGSAFALTAAAASAISVTGPFDPAAGTGDASTCELGATTVDSVTDGVSLTGFIVKPNNDTSYTAAGVGSQAVNPGCENADIYVRVDYTDLTSSTVKSIYASFPANGNYTGGKALDLKPSSSDWSTAVSGGSGVDVLALEEEALIRSVVLVSESEPTNFTP